MTNRYRISDAELQSLSDVHLSCIRETFYRVNNIIDIHDKKKILLRCIRCIKEIPKTSEYLPVYQLSIDLANEIGSPSDRKTILFSIARELPKTVKFASLYLDAIKSTMMAANAIDDPKTRKDSLVDITNDLPEKPDFQPVYIQAMTYAIKAADEIKDSQHRVHALLSLAKGIPRVTELNQLRLKALKLALNLATHISLPYYEKHLLDNIAKTLPKSSDVSFYRQYTLLGIAREIPKTGEFLKLYKEAIRLAIAAATTIGEPYYRKYALCYIAEEISNTTELFTLYKQTIMEALKAASAIVEPIVRIHALIDILKIFPKTSEFFPLLQQTLRDILDFYSVKKRISDISPIEVIDFILVAEEKGVRDSRKDRYTKTKYAHILAKELEQFGLLLNDIRFIEILKPYTHVWIKPKELRTAVSRIVDHLEGLKERFHGREIERPVFVNEFFPAYKGQRAKGKGLEAIEKDCISIDLGATNTVIMRRRWGFQPEFVSLKSISRQIKEVFLIPTVLSLKTDTVGAAVVGDETVSNLKKMLLEERQESGKYMERYLSIIYQHLKEEFKTPRWTSLFSNRITDKVYITVPIGFSNYKRSIKEIVEGTMKGVDVELLEEPLAAAIGYQMAEEKDKVAVVIDFGGSTLDVMVVRLNINEVHVIAKPDRSKILGGRDIDIWLAEYLSRMIGWEGEKPSAEMIRGAEDIKIALSDFNEVPFNWKGNEISRVSRRNFEEILDGHDFYRIVDRTISNVLWKAEKVGIKKDKIEAILLTGGSSQIPSFKEKIASIFPDLQEQNSIYTYSPFSAVAMGAALYPTRNITDKHLGLAYAIRYKTGNKEAPFAYEIIFEKGESLPFEKTFKVTPAKALGEQKDIYFELFEVPERYIVRRWERESGMEFIKQALKHSDDMVLKDLRIITIGFDIPIEEEIHITFSVNDFGQIKVRYGKENNEIETGIRLQ